jgi:hypothetical protein
MTRISPAAFLGLTLTLAVLAASAARAAAPIPPTSLVPHRGDLLGFAEAEFKLQATTSAWTYAKRLLEEKPREARKEAALLMREGFREGVQEQFHAERAGGVAGAQVFRSSRSATVELLRGVKQELTNPRPGARFLAPGIPGAQGFTGKTSPARRYADLLFCRRALRLPGRRRALRNVDGDGSHPGPDRGRHCRVRTRQAPLWLTAYGTLLIWSAS